MINHVKGKIQSWSIDNINNKIEKISVDDYLSYKKNLTPNIYTNDLASSANGISTDLQIKYIALSTAYDPPSKTDGLIFEVGRVTPLVPIQQINNKLIIEAKFDNTIFTEQKIISSDLSKKKFTVNNSTNLNVGDRIQIQINGVWEQRKIVDIDNRDITVNEFFSDFPLSGMLVQQMVSRLHLVYGSGATATLNSGKACSLAQLIAYKPSTNDLYTRHEIEFLGV